MQRRAVIKDLETSADFTAFFESNERSRLLGNHLHHATPSAVNVEPPDLQRTGKFCRVYDHRV